MTARRPAGAEGPEGRADEGLGPYRDAEGHRSVRDTSPLRPPRQRVAKRNARKEALVKCDFAPRRRRHPPPRDGSWGNRRRPKRARRPGKIGAGTDPPTPVQQLCTHVQSCDQAPFSLPPGAAHLPAISMAIVRQPNGWHPPGGHTGPPHSSYRGAR